MKNIVRILGAGFTAVMLSMGFVTMFIFENPSQNKSIHFNLWLAGICYLISLIFICWVCTDNKD